MPISRFFLSLSLALFFVATAWAQSLGKATADFPNARANKVETPFGRLVADALQNATGADCALINAGALRNGTLETGEIERADLAPLLSFSDDDVVKVSLAGAQIRAALERAASIYPTGSPAFLHCAGLTATFDPNAPGGSRLVSVRVKGEPLNNQKIYAVGMPVSLSEGAAGYFNIWDGAQATPANVTLLGAIENLVRQRGEISPEQIARFAPK